MIDLLVVGGGIAGLVLGWLPLKPSSTESSPLPWLPSADKPKLLPLLLLPR